MRLSYRMVVLITLGYFLTLSACKAKISQFGAESDPVLSPKFGLSAGGTLVEISDLRSENVDLVKFDNVECEDFKIKSKTSVTCVTNAHDAGKVDVTIELISGDPIVLKEAFTFVENSPAVTDVDPEIGSIAGGTTVTLTGLNLSEVTSVTFDGVAGTNLDVIDDTEITVDSPAHAAGSVDIEVTTPQGTATVANAFTYALLPNLTSINVTTGTQAGGVGFALTGVNLTGATSVTFDGVAATSVNVVNSTTVTGVTPAHAIGAVDIEISTPTGDATIISGFTYLASALGQSTGGGVIASLGGFGWNQFIAATSDASAGIAWELVDSPTGASDFFDGAGNTVAISSANPGQPIAANLCGDYEIDSQGNTPCEVGNTCYSDWFLPAYDQLVQFISNQVAIGGFAAGDYWGSTENDINSAHSLNILASTGNTVAKSNLYRVRCIRSFTP